MARTVALARYLFERLHQAGVHHIHGVPGDYTLKAINHLQACGIKWVGCCNELNAGYAADGYARTRGIGALFTTYGVGELSAINAVAGSYAEHVPVIHIVGLPRSHLVNSGAIVHHALGAGRTRSFTRMHEHVTEAQAYLENEHEAPDQIDRAISKAIYESRPACIEFPCNMIAKQVPLERLEQRLETQTLSDNNLSTSTNKVLSKLVRLLRNSKQPLLLVDRGMGMDQIRSAINAFVSRTGLPTLTMPSGASMIDHSTPNYFGVHAGPVGQINTMPYLDSTDLVLAFGPMFSDTQTVGWQVVPPLDKTITIHRHHVTFPNQRGALLEGRVPCDIRTLLESLGKHIDPSQLPRPNISSLSDFRNIKAPPSSDSEESINQTSFYLRLNPYLRPNDTVILGNATPILGGRDFVLPSSSTRVIASGLWFSIGSMLPAALGVGLAQRDSGTNGRVVLLDGDGSFQVTAQELSTIIHQRINITIFITNNGGYAYERLIHEPKADYHDIAPWDYLSLPNAFGASKAIEEARMKDEEYSVDTTTLRTWNDLDAFLKDERFDNGTNGRGKRGLKLVDVHFGNVDVPEKFRDVFESAGKNLG